MVHNRSSGATVTDADKLSGKQGVPRVL